MNVPIGIDDLNLYASTLTIDFAAIATARGIPARELDATGFARRSLTPPYEDPVTLAVNAAYPLVEAAGPDAFDLLLVATESGIDYGKPISTYVHRHLGLPSRCRNLELKHACYAGTAGVQLAVGWLGSRPARGGKALVITTDLARRHVGDPAELTAGSGAVAMVIAREPRILAIEPASGCACREIYDVARPSATAEWGDAVLSLAAYLDLLDGAWTDYRATADLQEALDQRFRYVLFHTPLTSLVRQALSSLLQADHDEISPATVDGLFERMVAPSLGHARETANIYSGSVYCLLAGLVDGDADVAAGTPVAVCSYGSGSCAEIYAGRIAGEARATVGRHRIADHLTARETVNVHQYERLVEEADAMMVARDYEPSVDFVPGLFERSYAGRRRLVLRRIENHHRTYAWCAG